jgi:hypothetical protein
MHELHSSVYRIFNGQRVDLRKICLGSASSTTDAMVSATT